MAILLAQSQPPLQSVKWRSVELGALWQTCGSGDRQCLSAAHSLMTPKLKRSLLPSSSLPPFFLSLLSFSDACARQIPPSRLLPSISFVYRFSGTSSHAELVLNYDLVERESRLCCFHFPEDRTVAMLYLGSKLLTGDLSSCQRVWN